MADSRRLLVLLLSIGIYDLSCGTALSQVGTTPGAGHSATPTLFVVGNCEPAVVTSLARFLDPAKILVSDRSAPTGLRTTIQRGAWSATQAMLRPGDFVLIQFARDEGPQSDAESLPGVSDDARRIAGTAPQVGDDTVQSYGWYLRRIAVEVIARGATPILSAPVMDGGAEQGRDEAWSRAIAVQQRIAFADAAAAADGMRVPGPANRVGTGKGPSTPERTAIALVAALRGLPNDPVAGYFSAEGNAVPPFRPPPPATTPLL